MLIRIFCILLSFHMLPLHAQTRDSRMLQPSPTQQWYTLTTAHFDIHFTMDHKLYAQRLAEIAEIQHEKFSRKMHWTPKLKTQIVVNDSVDFSNGATTVFPYNQFFVYMNEPTDGALKDQIDFVETLFTHEYTHVLHADQLAGLPARIRSIFGKSSSVVLSVISTPQVFAPHWVSEGIAVYNESQSGYGRSNSALFKAQMREEVIKGLASFTNESYEGYYGALWPFGQVYLYGAYFYEFLQLSYGEQAVDQYIRSYNKNIIPWRMSNRAWRATGKNARDLWAEFQQYLNEKFAKNISEIKAKGLTSGKIIYARTWQNRLLTPGPNDSLFFYHDDKKHSPQILQIFRDGKVNKITELKGVTSIQWHPQQGLLISKPQVCKNIRLYSDLYRFDLHTSRLHRLTQCARISRADWGRNAKSIIGIQSSNGKNRVVRVTREGTITPLAELDLGESIGQPDISPDGKHLVAAVKRKVSGWNLESFDLNKQQWTQLTHDADIPSLPTYSDDGTQVYFVSDHDSQIELRRLTLSTQMIETVSNSLGYIKQGVINKNEQVWVSEYTGQGEIIRKLDTVKSIGSAYSAINQQAQPIITLPNADDFNSTRHDQIKPYSAWETLRPHGWSPEYEADSKSWRLGLAISGQDILGFHRWSLIPTYYNFDSIDRYGGFASYSFNDRLTLSASRTLQVTYLKDDSETPDFNELQDNAQFLVHKPVNRFTWAMDLFAAIAWEETLNVTFKDNTANTSQDVIAGLGLSYNNFDHFNHAITADSGVGFDLLYESFDLIKDQSDHKGSAVIVQSQGNLRFADNQTFIATIDLGVGQNGGKPFSLGGSTESSETLGGITRLGRRKFALRGYSRNGALAGENFARASLAWHFPIASIYDGLYIPPLGLGKVKGNLFTEAGDAWNGRSDRTLFQSVGIELGAEILIGYDTLALPITFGFAHGLHNTQGEDRAYIRLDFQL